MTLADILERGYFPKELPNPFVTTSFALAVTAQGIVLPADFNHFPKGHSNKIIGKPTKYSHARGGLLRRQLCIPNPVLHYLLCCEFFTNWSALQPFIKGTNLSATNPIFVTTGRAIQAAQPQGARNELAVKTRLNNRYILRADISRFYHSIYTHSIPWALHTKAIAKANHKMNLLGNRLDYLIRCGQDSQTVGIPIGPDTSLVIAEILMQRCDLEILNAFPGIRGHRFIDDYELGFRNRTDAEKAFQYLEKILGDYELALNPSKTAILELPYNFEAPWVSALRSFEFRATPSGQQVDLFRYFDFAFEFYRQYPKDAVLQFAVGRLWNLEVQPPNWGLFQNLLLNCVAPEPAVLPYVLESIISRVNAGAIPALEEIKEVVNALIIDHSGLAHSSEVAWALWACLALGIKILPEAAKRVSECRDSAVALLALHCEVAGLVNTSLDHTIWSSYMNHDSLYEEHWLISYEANVKGWLKSQSGGDHVASDPNFQFLKAADVSFYDVTKAVRSSPGVPTPVPSLPTPPKVAVGGY
jgi:hypothetical protein